jgi:hypothetical protein
MYAENPPATGSRLASAAKVSASGNDSRHKTAQATMDAGPAVSAATAGRTRIPVPSTAPVYRATAVRRPMVRSSSTFIDPSVLSARVLESSLAPGWHRGRDQGHWPSVLPWTRDASVMR